MNDKKFILLSAQENDYIAEKVSKILKKEIGEVEFTRFACGETKNTIHTTLRKSDVYLILTFGENLNAELFEAFQLMHNIKTSHCTNLTVICPDAPYSRQDKRHGLREPNSARLLGIIMDAIGVDHFITIELHSPQIEGFHKSMDHLRISSIFADYCRKKYKNKDELLKKVVVLSPDAGSMKNATDLAYKLTEDKTNPVDVAFIHKERVATNVAKTGEIIGHVKGKDIIIFDDIIDTGGTLFGAASVAKKAGASKIIACCAHALMNSSQNKKESFDELLLKSDIDELIVTNTRPMVIDRVKKNDNLKKKITVLDISPYIAEAINRDQHGYTFSEMINQVGVENMYEVILRKK